MKVKCPRCGSNNVCEILYGMPTGEAFELAEQGKLILGGCDIIMDDLPQPDYGCLDCKFEWAPEMLLPSDIVKIRFKVWTSTECSGESQKYMIYEMFQDGLIRIYQYIGVCLCSAGGWCVFTVERGNRYGGRSASLVQFRRRLYLAAQFYPAKCIAGGGRRQIYDAYRNFVHVDVPRTLQLFSCRGM